MDYHCVFDHEDTAHDNNSLILDGLKDTIEYFAFIYDCCFVKMSFYHIYGNSSFSNALLVSWYKRSATCTATSHCDISCKYCMQ